MAFVENKQIQVGSIVKLLVEKSAIIGKFEVGSVVTVTGVSNRGYDIADKFGNKIIECGFEGFELVD